MEDAMRVDLYPADDVCSYACRLTRRCVIQDQPVRKHGQISVGHEAFVDGASGAKSVGIHKPVGRELQWVLRAGSSGRLAD
jgi:hypothetical protein